MSAYTLTGWVLDSRPDPGLESVLGSTPVLLGNHYFITNPAVGGTGFSPTFDFRAGVEQGVASAYVVAKKVGVSSSYRLDIDDSL